MLILLAALLAHAQPGSQISAAAIADAPSVLYIVSEVTMLRAEPDARSRAVTKLKPLDVVAGREVVSGWLKVEGAAAAEPGWIPLASGNAVKGTLEALKARVFRVQQTAWPARVKLEIALGRIREGFTANQVQLALGDPRRKDLRRTANDVAEEWAYDEFLVIFSHTGVVAIEPRPNP